MKVLFFSAALFLAIAAQNLNGAVWVAEPGLEPGQTNSLTWCVSQAAPGDSIYLQPGEHKGPLVLSKNLHIYGGTAGPSAISADLCPVETNNFTGSLERLTLIATHMRIPINVVHFTNSTINLKKVNIASASLAGEAIRIEGDSHITMDSCDVSYCARHPVIKLISCPNDVYITNSYWPAGFGAGHPFLVWDKADDPTLGGVIY